MISSEKCSILPDHYPAKIRNFEYCDDKKEKIFVNDV